jgi:hypothetical protein
MPGFLDTYSRLITTNILLATSGNEVSRLVSEAVKKLEEEKIQPIIIIHFIETIISDMEALGPSNLDPEQWHNAKTGRVLLLRKKRQLRSQPLI